MWYVYVCLNTSTCMSKWVGCVFICVCLCVCGGGEGGWRKRQGVSGCGQLQWNEFFLKNDSFQSPHFLSHTLYQNSNVLFFSFHVWQQSVKVKSCGSHLTVMRYGQTDGGFAHWIMCDHSASWKMMGLNGYLQNWTMKLEENDTFVFQRLSWLQIY